MAESITTKNITSVDEVQSVDNTDKVFVNDNGSFKQISVSNLMKQAPSGVTDTLPIMSSTQLGGGKAVEKTDEDVPVAVDSKTGQLFVPTYPENTGGGGGTVDPEQIQQAVDNYLSENPVTAGVLSLDGNTVKMTEGGN